MDSRTKRIAIVQSNYIPWKGYFDIIGRVDLFIFHDDLQYTKRMPSAFFETQLNSYLRWHKVDTVVVTGGSTSGCVRATAVDALSYGFRAIVPIETCADKHESYHFANLTDLLIKYADVEPVQTVIDWLEAR